MTMAGGPASRTLDLRQRRPEEHQGHHSGQQSEAENPLSVQSEQPRRPSRLRCRRCGTLVTDRSHCFDALGTGNRAVFANPHGIVFEILAVLRVENVLPAGERTSEFTWFPGYAWTPALCAGCGTNLGWVFDAEATSTAPSRFWGLVADYLTEDGDGGAEEGAGPSHRS